MYGQGGRTFGKTCHFGLALQQLCAMSAFFFREYRRNEIDVATSLSSSILQSVRAAATFLSYRNTLSVFQK
jgi:hypothetical protein